MAEPSSERPRAAALRWVVDVAPAVAFLGVLLATHDFARATVFLIAAAMVALIVGFIIERRLAPLPAFSGGLALLFGGASLLLHRADILQMKMTIVDGILGAVLFGGLMLGRNPLKALLGTAFDLSDAAWRTLAVRYGLFWWACAAANECVRRTQTQEVWATFRVVIIGAAVVFAIAQTPFLLRHNRKPGLPGTPPEPPESGL